MREEIINFIRLFSNGNDEMSRKFTQGLCYWFAFVLYNRFRGFSPIIMYDTIEDHFVVRIFADLYDITGLVTDKYRNIVDWETYPDSTHKQRIIRDCVLKERGM